MPLIGDGYIPPEQYRTTERYAEVSVDTVLGPKRQRVAEQAIAISDDQFGSALDADGEWLVVAANHHNDAQGSVFLFGGASRTDYTGDGHPDGCGADVNGDGVVNILDLLEILGQWR